MSDAPQCSTSPENRVKRIAVKDNEIRAIILLRLKLDQVSAKVRDDWPDEETAGQDWPVWVGVLPAITAFGSPIPDPTRNRQSLPPHVAQHGGRDRHRPRYLADLSANLDHGSEPPN